LIVIIAGGYGSHQVLLYVLRTTGVLVAEILPLPEAIAELVTLTDLKASVGRHA